LTLELLLVEFFVGNAVLLGQTKLTANAGNIITFNIVVPVGKGQGILLAVSS